MDHKDRENIISQIKVILIMYGVKDSYIVAERIYKDVVVKVMDEVKAIYERLFFTNSNKH